MAPQPAAAELRRLVTELAALTEQKIQATIARDHSRLLALLQTELDPLGEVQRILYSFPAFTPEERQDLTRLVEAWMERTAYLARLLETHLGYIDFARQALGLNGAAGLDTSW